MAPDFGNAALQGHWNLSQSESRVSWERASPLAPSLSPKAKSAFKVQTNDEHSGRGLPPPQFELTDRLKPGLQTMNS